jgi:transposase-like protein
MKEDNAIALPVPSRTTAPSSVLDELIREGARQMSQAAIENEAAQYLAQHQAQRGQAGRQAVVRNGHLPARLLVTGVGLVEVQQPRVRHRSGAGQSVSAIFPPYLRRVPSVDAVIPALYLKGVSTGDFREALEALLGPQAKGLSATNIVRLKADWQQEYRTWCRRDLGGKYYVYWWVDGIHFNARLDDERSCLVVIMAALARLYPLDERGGPVK